MSTTRQPSRPWYCIDPLVDEYLYAHRQGGNLRMLKALKIFRGIIVNVGIVSITVLAILHEANPQLVAPLGLLSLTAYNGIEIADMAALLQAIAESQHDAEADN
jgi:hypothetical protein